MQQHTQSLKISVENMQSLFTVQLVRKGVDGKPYVEAEPYADFDTALEAAVGAYDTESEGEKTRVLSIAQHDYWTGTITVRMTRENIERTADNWSKHERQLDAEDRTYGSYSDQHRLRSGEMV